MTWSAGGGALTTSGVSNANSATIAVTLTGVNSGELVVIGGYWQTHSFVSLSVNTGEAIDRTKVESFSTSQRSVLAWFKATSTSSKIITLTVSFANTASKLVWAKSYAYTGTDFAFDATASLVSSGTAPSVSVTTDTANDLAIGWIVNANFDCTVGANYTALSIPDDSTNYFLDAGEDLDAGSAGSTAIDFTTINGSTTWLLIGIAFKEISTAPKFVRTGHADSGIGFAGTTTTDLTLPGVQVGEMVVVGMYTRNTFVSVTVNTGETIQVGTTQSTTSNFHRVRLGYFRATGSSGTRVITLTILNAGNYRGLWADRFSAPSGASIGFNAEGGAIASGAQASSTVVTTQDNALVVGYVAAEATDSVSLGSGDYTPIHLGQSSGGGDLLAEYDLDAGAAGSKTVNFTSDTTLWATVSMAFVLLPQGDDVTVSDSVTVAMTRIINVNDTLTISEARLTGVYNPTLFTLVAAHQDSGYILHTGTANTSITCNAGDLVVCDLSFDSSTFLSFTVSTGETVTLESIANDTNVRQTRKAWFIAASNGSRTLTVSINVPHASRGCRVRASAWRCGGGGPSKVAYSATTGTSANPSTNLAVTNDNLVLGHCFSALEHQAGPGFTGGSLAGGSANLWFADEYTPNFGTAGTKAVSFQRESSNGFALTAIAFEQLQIGDNVIVSEFVQLSIPRSISTFDTVTVSEAQTANPAGTTKFVLASAHQDSGVLTSGNATVTISANTGEMVIIDCAWLSASFSSLTTSSGETVNLGTTLVSGNGTQTLKKGWFKATSSGSRTITFATSNNSFDHRVRASAWGCIGGTPSVVSHNASTGASTLASTDVTVTESNLVLGYCFSNSTTEPVEGVGFIGVATTEPSGGKQHDEYTLNAGLTAGNKAVTFSVANTFWVVTAIALEQGNVGDDVTVSDSPTLRLSFAPQVFDGVTATDVPTVQLNPLLATVFSGITVSDVPEVKRVAFGQIPIAEDVIVSESVSLHLRLNPSVSDNLTVSDDKTLESSRSVEILVWEDVTVSSFQQQLDHAVSTSHTILFSYQVVAAHTISMGAASYASHTIIVTFGMSVSHTIIQSIQGRILASHTIILSLTSRVQIGHVVVIDVRSNNQGTAFHTIRNRVIGDIVVIHPISGINTLAVQEPVVEQVYLLYNGIVLPLLEASVSQDENDGLWNGRLELAEARDFSLLSKGDFISIVIYGDVYEMVVESLSVSRTSRTERRFELNCKSPAWRTLGRYAPQVTKTWDAVSARSVVEELVGEVVDWQITDWIIPVERLAAVNQSPLDVVRTIVDTAGGVVESLRDGTLRARYLYPVTIPSVPGATLDQVLTEELDVFSSNMSSPEDEVFDKVVVADSQEGDGFLSAEADPDNPTVVIGGEQQGFLVFKDEKVEILQIILSDGSLINRGTKIIDVEEQVVFSNTSKQNVSKPIYSDLAWTWYGPGLGSLTADGNTVTASSVGVAIARVSYKALGFAYAVQSPVTSGGETSFPIIVYVVGGIK